MKRKIFKYIIFSLFLMIILSGCSKNQENGIKDKLEAEIEYVEDLIFKIANKYAKDEYIENEEFKWEYVKDDIEKINESWAQMMLDLSSINIPSGDILEYSDDLNNLLIAFSNQDENTMINELSNMYVKIVKFEDLYSENRNNIERDKIKSKVLIVYGLANKNEFENAKIQVYELLENYKNLMKDENFAKPNSYDLNKIYILLEEYKKSVEIQDIDLISEKYILAVEEI